MMEKHDNNHNYNFAKSAQALAGAQQSHPTAPSPIRPSFFNALDGVTDECSQTANRVCRLIDRLCGAVPEPLAARSQNASDANGLLDAAERQVLHIRESMSLANSALDRLEKMLP